MQWADVVKPPKDKVLRQFAGLWLVFFTGIAAWRAWHGQTGTATVVLAAIGLGIGAIGLIRPRAMRFIFTGWMIAAFPIGWTVSHVMLAILFYLVFAPVGVVFRIIKRDVLRVGRQSRASYWTTKPKTDDVAGYFRQS